RGRRGWFRRGRLQIDTQLEQREQRKDNNSDCRSHEGEWRIREIQPAEISSPGCDGWRRKRTQARGEADTQGECENVVHRESILSTEEYSSGTQERRK